MATKSKINQPVTINGKKHWITANTAQEFTDKILKLSTSHEQGKHVFSEYAWNWFHTYSEPTVRAVTAINYKRQLELHILPVLGELMVEDITAEHIQSVFNRMNCTKESKNKVRTVLNQILNLAVDDNLLSKNPLSSKRIKITGKNSHPREPYTVEEMRYLIKHIPDVKNPMDRLFLAIAALHPLRLEEVLGLRSEDIDIENRLIHIRRGVTHPDNNRPHVDETKTAASVRMISLAKLAVPHIPILKKGQYLFGGNDPITYQKRVLMCKRIQKDTKFDGKVTPARFRTTVLTDIYDQTKDIKLTQQASGHTSPKMTLERYVKGRSDLNKAAEVINATYSAQLENSWAG